MRPTLLRRCLGPIAALLAAAPAYPWGVEGHRAIAIVAERGLSPAARSHVEAILGGADLASVAVWMDDLRSAYFHTGPLGSDAEALKFNAEFPHNNEWHYVDLPLGTLAYRPDDPFASPHDVVHMAEAAVDVLEGGGDQRITKLEALRMLVHFVGDLHQPLHVGNGYFELGAAGAVTLVTDPAKARGLPNDKGGNADFFGPGRYDELHAYWDVGLVEKIPAPSKEPADLSPVLEKDAAAAAHAWDSTGDYHHWPEGWATESLAAARTAYRGIAFGTAAADGKGGIKRIAITLPANYDAVCVPLAEQRLAQAAYHLAEILNAITWPD